MSERIHLPWAVIVVGALVPGAQPPRPIWCEPEPHELPPSTPVTGAAPPEDAEEPNPRWCTQQEPCRNCGWGLSHDEPCELFTGDYEAPIDPSLCKPAGRYCPNCGRGVEHTLPCPGTEHHRPRPDEDVLF